MALNTERNVMRGWKEIKGFCAYPAFVLLSYGNQKG